MDYERDILNEDLGTDLIEIGSMEHRIKNWEMHAMFYVAFAFDALQGISYFFLGPLAAITNRAVALVAWIVFFIWFKIKGVNIFGVRRLGKTVVGFVFSSIPGWGALPWHSIYVAVVLVEVRVLDNKRIQRIKEVLEKLDKLDLIGDNF